MESDYLRWEDTGRTKQVCGPEEQNSMDPHQFSFSDNALRTRQDRGLCGKAVFRFNTEVHQLVHINVLPTSATAGVLQTTKRDPSIIKFRQMVYAFHKPFKNRLNRFLKFAMSTLRQNTHTASFHF